GVKKAVVAVAHRIAVIAYFLLRSPWLTKNWAAITLTGSIRNAPPAAWCVAWNNSATKSLFSLGLRCLLSLRFPTSLNAANAAAGLVNAHNVELLAFTRLSGQSFRRNGRRGACHVRAVHMGTGRF